MGDPILYEYMPDKMLKEPRNISIGLNESVARFVKIELFFSNVWISISEITFSLAIAEGKFEKESVPKINIHEISTTRNTWEEVTHSTRDDKLFDHSKHANNKITAGKSIYTKYTLYVMWAILCLIFSMFR